MLLILTGGAGGLSSWSMLSHMGQEEKQNSVEKESKKEGGMEQIRLRGEKKCKSR